MKSTGLRLLAAATAVFVMVATTSEVHSQTNKKVVVKNVNKDTGEISAGVQPAGQWLEIPVDATNHAVIDSAGDIQIRCAGNPGDTCLSLGAGGGVGAPSLTITGPITTQSNPISSGSNQMITWTTSAGATCYGIRSSGPNNSTVASWNNISTALSSGAFSTAQLSRNPSSTVYYDLTLGCFATPIAGSSDVSTGYTQKTHRIYLAQSNQQQPSGCAAYMAHSYGGVTPQGTRGFQNTGLTEKLVGYTEVFSVGYQQTVNDGTQGFGFPPNTTAGVSDYMAIQIPVGSEVGRGVQLTWNTPQTQPYTGSNVMVSISPCPGDFRQPNANSSDPWLSPACRKHQSVVGSAYLVTPDAAGSVPGTACRLNGNSTMYLNVAAFNFVDYWAGSQSSPQSPCPAGKVCSVKMNAKQYPSQ